MVEMVLFLITLRRFRRRVGSTKSTDDCSRRAYRVFGRVMVRMWKLCMKLLLWNILKIFVVILFKVFFFESSVSRTSSKTRFVKLNRWRRAISRVLLIKLLLCLRY